MRLMGECRGSIDAVKRAEGELTEDEDDMPGLTNPTSTDTQSAGQLHTNTHIMIDYLLPVSTVRAVLNGRDLQV